MLYGTEVTVCSEINTLYPFKYEAQTALFKDTVRTAQ
jgi:hypothetical protein